MADSLSMDKVLRAYLKSEGFNFEIDPEVEVRLDCDGDIVYGPDQFQDFYDMGSYLNPLIEFTIKHVNEEWL